MKTQKAGSAGRDRMQVHAMAWSAGSTSKPSAGEPTVRFMFIESFAEALSPRHRELPALIAKEHPDPLTEPAALGAAGRSNPSRMLEAMLRRGSPAAK